MADAGKYILDKFDRCQSFVQGLFALGDKRGSTELTEEKSILVKWYGGQSLVRKIFAPGDFRASTEFVEVEDFTCTRSTTDLLLFSTREAATEMTLRENSRYSRDLGRLDYKPQDFKTQTIQVIVDSEEFDCRECDGDGYTDCPPTSKCLSCNGFGDLACNCRGDHKINCPTCKGERQIAYDCTRCNGTGFKSVFDGGGLFERCPHCDGQKKFPRDCHRCLNRNGEPTGRVPCDKCGGSGRLACNRCRSEGAVTCEICGGRGLLHCQKCDSEGRMILAQLATNTFTHQQRVQYPGYGDGIAVFKNGVGPRHLQGRRGKLVQDEYRDASGNVVLHRVAVEDFDVHSYKFRYGRKQFYLNHLRGAGGQVWEFSTRTPPLCVKKTALVLGAVSLVVLNTVASLWLLNYF